MLLFFSDQSLPGFSDGGGGGGGLNSNVSECRSFFPVPVELAVVTGYSLKGLRVQKQPPSPPDRVGSMELNAGRQRRRRDPQTHSISFMDPSVCALELLGLFLCGVAWLASLTTTLMSTWLTLSTELLATETFQLGLWETCVVQELGGLECRPYNSLLGLPQNIMLARTLMCVALAVGLLGFLLTIPGLYLVNSCHGQGEDLRCKRGLKMSGGVLNLVAGVLVLVPVSYIAHVAVTQFFDETVPEMIPRWEFGDALFCGWTAGFVHLLAGTMLLASSLCLQNLDCGRPGPSPKMGAPLGIPFMKTRSEYV